MMLKRLLFWFLLISYTNLPNAQSADKLKPRMIVLTDVSTWETDDSESLVRLMVHLDLIEVEGLVFTTGWSMGETRDDFMGLIHKVVDAYEKDLSNLRKLSKQTEHLENENQQSIGYWPSPDYLRDRTVYGSKKRGAKFLGEGNDSPGSQLIINLADEDDDRPLWISIWGGGNTLAQAIWRVKQERNESDFRKFLRKLRVYAITDQDRDQKTPYSDSSHLGLRRDFNEDLFFLWDECAWKFQNGTGRKNWSNYETHIQGHGNLGTEYPKYKYGVEGDTPAFLHLLPIGLNDPEIANHGGWGGYFDWTKSEDNETHCYTNSGAPTYQKCLQLEEHFYAAIFNSFAARMDWAKYGEGNRNPSVEIENDPSTKILKMTPQVGQRLHVDASGSKDPDGDALRFKWWVLTAAGTYDHEVKILGDDQEKATILIPIDSHGETIHVICEVTDNGTHNLTSYRRIIIEPRD